MGHGKNSESSPVKIDLYPTTCNICGGEVIYTSNSIVYDGREYGSGKCYYCTKCGAYVGTHEPEPLKAYGLLANDRMRAGKIKCHALFDPHWKDAKNRRKARNAMYRWLSEQMGIPSEMCHFGFFTLEQLLQAHSILNGVKGRTATINKQGVMEFY